MKHERCEAWNQNSGHLESSQEVFSAFEFLHILCCSPALKWEAATYFFACYRKKRVNSSAEGHIQACWHLHLSSEHLPSPLEVSLRRLETHKPVEGLSVTTKKSLRHLRFSGAPGHQAQRTRFIGGQKKMVTLAAQRLDSSRRSTITAANLRLMAENPDKTLPPVKKAPKDGPRWNLLGLNVLIWGHTVFAPVENVDGGLTYPGTHTPAITSRLSTSNRCHCILFSQHENLHIKHVRTFFHPADERDQSLINTFAITRAFSFQTLPYD